MFNFNNYNPFRKAWDAIASEIASPQFKVWVKCKRDHDIQLVADLALGAIAGFIQASNYCFEQGKVARVLVGTDSDSVTVNGLGSAIYKAGRHAYEAGSELHTQILQGMQSDLLASPQAMALELDPPSGVLQVNSTAAVTAVEPLALPAAIQFPPMPYKNYVMSLLGDRTVQDIAERVTKKQMIKALRQGGLVVRDRTRKADVLKMFSS